MATPRKRPAAASVPRSAMSHRLLKLAAETNLPEPYPIADGIVVTPPGKKRREAMSKAEMRIYLTSGLLNQAMARTTPPAPTMAENDATADQLAAYEHAKAEWDRQTKASEDELNELSAQIDAARADYERAFFGDVYDAVIEYFDDPDVPQQLWDAFVADIQAEFLPAAPDNGTCPTCGHVEDEEAAERAPKSSTSSTTTGTTLSAT